MRLQREEIARTQFPMNSRVSNRLFLIVNDRKNYESSRNDELVSPSYTQDFFERSSSPQEKNLLIQALATFKSLEDDWNGFGAIAPNPKSIESALQVIKRIPFNRLYPLTVSIDEGNIVMTWKNEMEIMELIIEPALMHLYKKSKNEEAEYVDNEIFDGENIPQKILSYIPIRKS